MKLSKAKALRGRSHCLPHRIRRLRPEQAAGILGELLGFLLQGRDADLLRSGRQGNTAPQRSRAKRLRRVRVGQSNDQVLGGIPQTDPPLGRRNPVRPTLVPTQAPSANYHQSTASLLVLRPRINLVAREPAHDPTGHKDWSGLMSLGRKTQPEQEGRPRKGAWR
jgi:hypothetical protein